MNSLWFFLDPAVCSRVAKEPLFWSSPRPASLSCTRCNTKLLPLEVKCKPHLQIQLVARLLPLNTTTAGSHKSAELGHVVLAKPETQNPKEIKPSITALPKPLYRKTMTSLLIVLAPPLSSKM